MTKRGYHTVSENTWLTLTYVQDLLGMAKSGYLTVSRQQVPQSSQQDLNVAR